LDSILKLIDLTSLNETDTELSIKTLCHKAVTPFGHVAAVCVYPKFVQQAKTLLQTTPVKIATVVNFPEGKDSLQQVLPLIAEALSDGANEIDVVFPYTQYLAGQRQMACNFIHQCKEACGDNILKVILESGALNDETIITEASRDALLAGADFLKTSTGKIAAGASLSAATAMLKVIKQLSGELKRPLGFKASGGIRTIEQAQQYLDLANQIMGTGWISPKTFRFGASQLLDEVVSSLKN
jgi:deoxyribose-phosphate aldolase